MSLAKRDLHLVQIDKEIQNKRQFLLDKHKENERLAQENEYLQLIRNDYAHYYDHIVREKETQISSMRFLNDYIDKIVEEGELTDEDLERSRSEQRKILDEIDDIKSGLDTITSNNR